MSVGRREHVPMPHALYTRRQMHLVFYFAPSEYWISSIMLEI